MTDSRTEILAKIRRVKDITTEHVGAGALTRLAEKSSASTLQRSEEDITKNYAAIARDYNHSGKLDLQSRLDLFAERLRDYGTSVHRCSSEQISSTIAQVLVARHLHRILIPEGIPASWLDAPDIEFVAAGSDLTYAEIDKTEGVLTACTAAIALTGTILLRHSPTEGSRALTLIPDYHLCVVFESQVLETVPEAIRYLEAFRSLPITTISGPSATSDIEMTRIKGVHGPRTLDVLLVRGLAIQS